MMHEWQHHIAELAQQDPIVAGVFLLLAAMSLLSWLIGFCKLAGWLLERLHLQRFLRQHGGRLFGTVLPAPEQGNGQVRVILQQLQQLKSELDELITDHREAPLQTGVQQILERNRLQMEAGLSTLASIGSAAPFVGLFGTVWGIYLALDSISQQQSASITVVAGPMGEALLATAAGLFAAIPAVLAYNAFLRLNRIHAQSVRHLVERLQFACLPATPPAAKEG
jgi:biopolymer transport protein ExbB